MAGGEPLARDPRCPHCDRHWHGLAVTEKIAEMYDGHGWDENYKVSEDDTPVLCPGSDFIGPIAERGMGVVWAGTVFGWLAWFERALDDIVRPLRDVPADEAEEVAQIWGIPVSLLGRVDEPSD